MSWWSQWCNDFELNPSIYITSIYRTHVVSIVQCPLSTHTHARTHAIIIHTSERGWQLHCSLWWILQLVFSCAWQTRQEEWCYTPSISTVHKITFCTPAKLASFCSQLGLHCQCCSIICSQQHAAHHKQRKTKNGCLFGRRSTAGLTVLVKSRDT